MARAKYSLFEGLDPQALPTTAVHLKHRVHSFPYKGLRNGAVVGLMPNRRQQKKQVTTCKIKTEQRIAQLWDGQIVCSDEPGVCLKMRYSSAHCFV